MDSIVTNANGLTAEWFTSVLGSLEPFAGAEIEGLEVEPVGGGVIARMVRVTPTYVGETSAPKSFVVKYATEDPGSFGLAQAMGMYELETRFYQDIAPLIPDMPLPRCFAAAHEPATGMFTLVLEDLGSATRTGSVLEESTPEECRNVLGALAKFQAPLWNSKEVAALDWIADPRRTIGVFDSLPAGVEPFLARLGHHLEPRQVECIKSILPFAPDWVRSWSAPTVVQHGDFRSDNMLHGLEASVPPVTVIDFQTVRLGPPGVDAAYFVGSALSTEKRRELERDLVEGYHKELIAGGVDDFDLDACWKAYRAGALYGVCLFVGMGAQVEGSDHANRIMADQIKRYVDMAIDLDALEAAGLA